MGIHDIYHPALHSPQCTPIYEAVQTVDGRDPAPPGMYKKTL